MVSDGQTAVCLPEINLHPVDKPQRRLEVTVR
jgi:hypothetical protein